MKGETMKPIRDEAGYEAALARIGALMTANEHPNPGILYVLLGASSVMVQVKKGLLSGLFKDQKVGIRYA